MVLTLAYSSNEWGEPAIGGARDFTWRIAQNTVTPQTAKLTAH